MEALTKQQQSRLNKAKVQLRIDNEEYLRSHPELQSFISLFMKGGESGKHRKAGSSQAIADLGLSRKPTRFRVPLPALNMKCTIMLLLIRRRRRPPLSLSSSNLSFPLVD